MTGRDDLVVLREFGLAVAKALNDAKVTKPADKSVCAVMVVVGEPGEEKQGRMPVGGVLNLDQDTGVWSLDEQVEPAERVS